MALAGLSSAACPSVRILPHTQYSNTRHRCGFLVQVAMSIVTFGWCSLDCMWISAMNRFTSFSWCCNEGSIDLTATVEPSQHPSHTSLQRCGVCMPD